MVMKWMKEMDRKEFQVVCPHIEYHMLGNFNPEFPTRWTDRSETTLRLIEPVDAVQVLMFSGWEESACVKDEVTRAKALGKPVTYVNTEALQSWFDDLERERSDYLSGLELQVRLMADSNSVRTDGNAELRDAEPVDGGREHG